LVVSDNSLRLVDIVQRNGDAKMVPKTIKQTNRTVRTSGSFSVCGTLGSGLRIRRIYSSE
jgi:hypothetical protein